MKQPCHLCGLPIEDAWAECEVTWTQQGIPANGDVVTTYIHRDCLSAAALLFRHAVEESSRRSNVHPS